MSDRTELALQRSLIDVIAEYDEKVAAVGEVIAAFEAAGVALKSASTIGGTWGQTQIDTGRVTPWNLKDSLLKSAWLHVYNGLNLEQIASAKDKKLFQQALEKPAPFTIDNIRASFGHYLADPRGNILRGLAEVFCDLDPAFKSHDKVKIGVKGLPKRVIVSGFGGWSGYGKDKVRDILNALAAYQRKPMVEYAELDALMKDENASLASRGIRLRRFDNGNGHLFFEPHTLRDINLALAEFYGDALADDSMEKPEQQRASTAVAKDLQYYPTPAKVVERVLDETHLPAGSRVLEPSCGCGRLLDALRSKGADVQGIEVDPGRAAEARAKGHKVHLANFLETVPTAVFDFVVMNPPFYGRHYAKHVEHAMKFLKLGGKLIAILPVTARYDHGLLEGNWHDLPVGSFSESGTNINTTIFTKWAR